MGEREEFRKKLKDIGVVYDGDSKRYIAPADPFEVEHWYNDHPDFLNERKPSSHERKRQA